MPREPEDPFDHLDRPTDEKLEKQWREIEAREAALRAVQVLKILID